MSETVPAVCLALLGASSCVRDTPTTPSATPNDVSSPTQNDIVEEPGAKAPSHSSAGATVQLSLEANVAGLDGREFWLAARLHPPEGTHLYWQNPGETGLPTTAEFRVPAQYQLSEVKYPGPVRLQSERGATTYGYVEDAVLLVRVSPLAENDEATFKVFGSWLSCGLVCVRESGEAELTLPVATGAVVETDAFESFVAALPHPANDIAVSWPSQDEVEFRHRELKLVDYFPIAPFGLEDRAPDVMPQTDGSLRVRINRQSRPKPLIAIIEAAGEAQSLYFEVTLEPSPTHF